MRIFYIPGEAPRECFQVVVFPPVNGNVAVQAASIETSDDSDFIMVWEGPAAELNGMLEVADSTIRGWINSP